MTEITSEQLEPCPFCGSRAAEHENDYCDPPEHGIYCTACHAQGLSSIDRDFAIAEWNRRASVAEIERLRRQAEADRRELNDLRDFLRGLAKQATARALETPKT